MIDWSLSPASVAALAGEFLVFKVFLNISLSPKKKGGLFRLTVSGVPPTGTDFLLCCYQIVPIGMIWFLGLKTESFSVFNITLFKAH